MKKTKTSTLIATALVFLIIASCEGRKDKISDHEHTNDKQESAKGDTHHKENDEVMFTAKQYEALHMKIDTLQKRNITGYVEANGSLEVPPQNEAIITSVIGANIMSIKVIEGDQVNKGQVLAYLSHPDLIKKQSAYLTEYSRQMFLKKESDRQKTLYDAGVGSGASFQKAESEYKASKAMTNGFEAQLQQLNINVANVRNGTIQQRVALRSPIEGFVEKVYIKTGQYVAPQTNLIEIVNTDHVHADLMVFEKDVYKIKKGQKVIFSVQSIPGLELTAEIYSVGKTFEQDPKALHVHAEIENKEGKLIPGMYIQGQIQTENKLVDAFPEIAIAIDGEKSFVFRAVREGNDWSFVPVEIITGSRDREWVAISFLKPQVADALYAMNNAYYLIAEMKKGEAEHSH